MNNFFLLLFLSVAYINPVVSQSGLLETVKKNPGDAIDMCNKFKELNSKGISASSDKAIEFVSKKNNLKQLLKTVKESLCNMQHKY